MRSMRLFPCPLVKLIRSINGIGDERREGEGLGPTSSIDEIKSGGNTIRTKTRPIRYQINPPRSLPHTGPIVRPPRSLKRAHQRPPIYSRMCPRYLELVDNVHDAVKGPVPAAGHIEGREERESAGGFSSGVGETELGEGPAVRGADVHGETIDADGFGVVDVFGPLVRGLAVCKTDLVCIRGVGVWT
jgi:hypothetical protein